MNTRSSFGALRAPVSLLFFIVIAVLFWAVVAGVADADPGRTAGSAQRTPGDRTGQIVPGQVIVRFKDGTSAVDRGAVRDAADVSVENVLPLPQLQLLAVEDGQSVAETVRELEAQPDVAYAEPNYYRHLNAAPNDPEFGGQYALDAVDQIFHTHEPPYNRAIHADPDVDVDAPEAWDIFDDGSSQTVAIVDSGVDYTHADLAPNMWVNPGESGSGRESNNLDDDNNGYVDDWRGYDFAGSPESLGTDPDNDPMDEYGHGTHVAGIASARSNDNYGISGVSGNARIMPVRIFDAYGLTSVANEIDGLAYAADMGADVVNGSFGGWGSSRSEAELIESFPNTTFVFAAGNDLGADNDEVPMFPCVYASSNVICVGASNVHGEEAIFSNHGARSVDVFAPGESITSDRLPLLDDPEHPDDLITWDGTSMAAPLVSGAVALLHAYDPGASVARVKAALVDGVDRTAGLSALSVSGGRMNLATSLGLLNPNAGTTKAAVSNGRLTVTAGSGAANNISISPDGSNMEVSDTGASLEVGNGCVSEDAHTALCETNAIARVRIDSGDFNDHITTAPGFDSEIDAGSGDDEVVGGNLKDVIDGGTGTDTLSGGGGSNDVVTYDSRTEPLILSLDGVANDGAAGENDSLTGFEGLRGGLGDDEVWGDGSPNTLGGGGGDDAIHGLGGSDTLLADNGSDVLSGGGGTDVADYANRSTPTTISLDDAANDGVTGDGENDNVNSDVEDVRTGAGADQLVGSSVGNVLDGGSGDDRIDGGAGADTLVGGSGTDTADYSARSLPVSIFQDGDANDGELGENDNVDADVEVLTGGQAADTITGGSTDNRLFGGPGADVMFGGDGTDWVDYSDHLAAVTVTVGVGSNDGAAGEGDNVQADVENVRGTALNDSLTGSDAANVLDGWWGDDQLDGGAGDDRISGDLGTDILSGGDGSDTADYNYTNDTGIITSISLDGTQNDGPLGENDWIKPDVENVLGGWASDVIYGNNSSNRLNGGGMGMDAIYGSGGDDIVEAGDELIVFPNLCGRMGQGGKIVDGGSGNDLVYGGAGGGDLRGGDGDDVISPVLAYLPPGKKCRYVTGGQSVMSGGDGEDTVTYAKAPIAVVASLDGVQNDGLIRWNGGDKIESDVENLTGGELGDELTGNSSANKISGGPGSDKIDGGGGADQLNGDDGSDYVGAQDGATDQVYCGDGADSVTADVDDTLDSCETNRADLPVVWLDGTDLRIDGRDDVEEKLTLSDSRDLLRGDSRYISVTSDAGPITAGAGCEIQTASEVRCEFDGAENVVVDTKDGDDEVVSGLKEVTATVDLGDGNDSFDGGPVDESVEGGAGSDTLTSGGGADHLDGGDGDDTLLARDGGVDPDSLVCGAGTADTALVDSNDTDDGECEAFKLAPDTTITAGPADSEHISDTTPQFAFTSDEAGSTFECRVDGGAWAACLSGAGLTSLPDGEHEFSVRAVDGLATDPTPATRTFVVDTVAPQTIITSGPANGWYDEGSYSLGFQADEEATFECSPTSGVWYPCESGWGGSLSLGATASPQVRAIDLAGNIDPTPELRTITYALPRLVKTDAATDASLDLTTDGPSGWAHWGLATTPSLTGDRKLGLSTTTLANPTKLGSGSLTRVDSVTPAASWSGSGTPTVSSTGTSTAIATGGALGRGFHLVARASSSQPRTLKLYVGAQNTTGKLTATLSNGSLPAITDTTVTSGPSDGPVMRVFTINFRAQSSATTNLLVDWTQDTDSTDSSSYVLLHSASLSFGIDNTRPNTTITSGPAEDSVVNSSSAAFEFSSTEPGSTFECKFDTGAYAPCTDSYTATGLSDGPHTMKVMASDVAGNTDSSPASRSFWVTTPVGQLSQSIGTPPTTVTTNLEGTTDWAHWGALSSSMTPDHKANITRQISDATKLGSGYVGRPTSGVQRMAWTGGGTPLAAVSGTISAISTAGAIGRGYSITMPALTTQQRVLRLYVGVANATGHLTATLSDGSAVQVEEATLTSSSSTYANRMYVIPFRAAAPGTTLTVSWTLDTSPLSSSQVALTGATLVTTSDVTPPTGSIVSGPGDNEIVPSSGAAFSFASSESGSTFQCSLDGALFASCSSTYATGSLASGVHRLVMRAIDPAGNVEQKPSSRTIVVL